MNVSCVLCDRLFSPTSFQEKKLRKHPHRIFLCPDCHRRISERTRARKRSPQTRRNYGVKGSEA
ncbi:DUF2197 domain-containing protein [Salinithrix halophila]|uniref:DUF2197 domain-containing protein n=1 Tax=Salinithrix halophila TaxID=1485204 RepID=A0ABV8JDB0_9BACL